MDKFLAKDKEDCDSSEDLIARLQVAVADIVLSQCPTGYETLVLRSAQLLPPSLARDILTHLERELEWNPKSQVRVFGKWHRIPRQQTAFGDPGTAYTFSGSKVEARGWVENGVVAGLRDLVCSVSHCDFNFVLVNRYRDGNDCIGFHRDDEAGLDSNAPIASLSLGQSRDFLFAHHPSKLKHGEEGKRGKWRTELVSGQLLLMDPPTNTHWLHSIPKRRRINGVRINLTFRKLL